MAIYQDYAKISLVQLPNGSGTTTYALVDRDGRLMITEQFSSSSAQTYSVGDYVIYEDNLYICTASTTGGTFDANDWVQTDVVQELVSLKNSISGGIHYVGVTYSSLYEGSTMNPISIGPMLTPHTAIKGDLTIEQPPGYVGNAAYTKGQYITHEGIIYQITKDVTAAQNTNWIAMTITLDAVRKAVTEPEFIWDGTAWNEIGSISPNVFGKLAFKDTATGSYVKPTGTGSVTVPTITPTYKNLSTTTITGTDGTESVSAVSGGSTKDIAKVGTAVRYGTANVGTAVTYGTANRAASPTTVGNANVGTAVVYGTANKASSATTVGNANVGNATVYGTANKDSTAPPVGTALGGTTTFNTEGYTATVNSETLVFAAGNTGTVTLTKSGIYEAVDAPNTQTLTPAAASSTTIYGAVDAPNTQKLTPAAASTTTIYGAETSTATLTPAVAAPNDQTLTPAESNGQLTGSYTIAAKTVAKVAASATTVATGELETGAQLVSAVTIGSSTGIVTVNTTTDTVTVS